VCDCFLKDLATYLDHINGRKHQRHMGFSTRTEKSTTKGISTRLRSLAALSKKESLGRKNHSLGGDTKDDEVGDTMDKFEMIVQEKDEEAANMKAEWVWKREKRKKKKKKDKEEENRDNPDDMGEEDMAAMMGFSNFCRN